MVVVRSILSMCFVIVIKAISSTKPLIFKLFGIKDPNFVVHDVPAQKVQGVDRYLIYTALMLLIKSFIRLFI